MLTYEEEQHQAELNPEINEVLCTELGWGEVGKGLTRIIMGWGLLIGGSCFGAGLLALSVTMAKDKGPGGLWAFFLGLAMLGVAGMFSYGILLAGQLRCLIHTPEREGARWFIFTCMVCLAMGPVINVASYFGCTTQKADLNKGVRGLNRIEFNSTGRYIQGASAIAGIGYNICFILYLRSIGSCFAARPLVLFVDLYLLYHLSLVGTTIYLLFMQLQWAFKNPAIFLILGAGYCLQFLWFMTLLVATRLCIFNNLARVRNSMGNAVFPQ